MTAKSFVVGEIYFHVTYPDVQMRYPGIDTLVYLGKNLSDEDVEDTWYFQPASDFGRHGSALQPGASKRPVHSFKTRDIEDVLDLAELVPALEVARSRRNKRNA